MSDHRNQRSTGRDLLRLALDSGDGDARGAHPDENQLALYLSRELSEDARARVEAHAAACEECSELLAFAADDAALPGQAGTGTAEPQRAALRVVSSNRAPAAKSESDDRVRTASRRPPAAPRDASPARAARSRAASGRRVGFRAAAAIALALLAGGVATAGWLALRWAGPVVSSRSSDALHRKVSTDGLSFTVSGGPGLRLEDLRIADDPRFSPGDFATASDATLQVDPAELLRGRLRGSISVSDLVLRLVRNPDGEWNVETIGGERLASGRIDDGGGEGDGAGSGTTRPVAPGTIPPGAGNGPLRLVKTNLDNGKLVVADLGRGTELVIDHLALAADSPDAARPATIALTGRVGANGKVEVSGNAGPFLRHVPASYDLSQVVLERVPTGSVPFVPASLHGDLSFHGRLSSSGKKAKPILENLAGRGDLSLAAGRLDGANLARLLLAAVDAQLAAEGAIRPGDLLPAVDAAARDDSGLAEALSATSTDLDRVKGPVEIGQKLMGTKDLAISNALLDASATGTVDGDGQVRATGAALLSPTLTRAVLAAAPAAAALGVHEGRLELPFVAVGAWPDLRFALAPAAR
ncbi:MAG: AsmA-like C-terminal region-containing protein [Alphaproteobacteria bacterium]